MGGIRSKAKIKAKKVLLKKGAGVTFRAERSREELESLKRKKEKKTDPWRKNPFSGILRKSFGNNLIKQVKMRVNCVIVLEFLALKIRLYF